MPTPILNRIRQQIGYSKHINFHVNAMPSNATKMKNTISISPKLMSDWIFRDNKNKYFGTLTLVKIPALPMMVSMPPFVASMKKEKTRVPQKIKII